MTATLERDQYLEDTEFRALLGNTGIRPGELVALTVADFHLADRDAWLRVRRLKKRAADGRIADVPLSRALARRVRPYVARLVGSMPPPCEQHVRPFKMTVRNLENVFRYYARRAGLERAFRLYALRHTALTRAIRATGDLRLVQDMAGHASPSTTAIYTHVDPAKRRELAERVGGIL